MCGETLINKTLPTLKGHSSGSLNSSETLHRIDAVCVLLLNHDSFIMGETRHLLRHFMIICKCLPDETESFSSPHEVHLGNRSSEFTEFLICATEYLIDFI